MTVKEIIENFLKSNGYDVLYNEDVDCACKLDDLMPCGYSSPECKAGYLIQEDEYGSFLIRTKEAIKFMPSFVLRDII